MGRRPRAHGPYAVDDEEGAVTAPGPAGALLARLQTDPRIRTAALVASSFRLDPVDVLDESDPLKRLLRVAAHNVLQDEQRAATKRTGSS